MSTPRKNIITVTLAGKLAFALAGGVGVVVAPAFANDFTADKVMNHMTPAERTSYLAGVIEGLAVARYMKDGRDKKGMECIYDWCYDDQGTMRTIHAALDKYASYPPGSILDTLSKQKCGE